MQNFYWYSGYVAKPNNYYPQPLLSPQDIPQVVAPSTMMAPGKNDMEKLKEKFKRLERENIQLKRELAMLQEQKEKKNPKRKVFRRPENLLVKSYGCPYQHCKKQYASTLALNLHIKIKHNGGNKKDRDELAEAIIDAEKQGKEPPKSSINLPPNYIDEYKRERMEAGFKFPEENENDDQSAQKLIKLEECVINNEA